MELSVLLVEVICGALGGSLAGVLNNDRSLGSVWNSLIGATGGAIGAQGLAGSGLFGGFGLGTTAILSAVCGLGLTVVFGMFRK